jgi:hypothetical protein
VTGSTFRPAAAPPRATFRRTEGPEKPLQAKCAPAAQGALERAQVLWALALRVLARFPEAYRAVQEALVAAEAEASP